MTRKSENSEWSDEMIEEFVRESGVLLNVQKTALERGSQTVQVNLDWSEEEIEQLCWDAGVLTLVSTQGFRKAATEEFWKLGYRLATISRDFEPFDYIHKLSLYMLGDRPRLGHCEAKRLTLSVMQRIGLPPRPDECHVDVAGRRLIVSVALPHWARPNL